MGRIAEQGRYTARTRQNFMKPEASKCSSRQYIAIGASLGLCFGAGLGAAMHNVGLGIGIGLALGTAIGAALARKKSKD